jgi:small GTP-binding protein
MSSTKALIVGDGAIGKTCLLSAFTNDASTFDDGEPEYEPTTFNNFILEWQSSEGKDLTVEMWDTAGQEAFEQLRKLSYPGTDIFLIGYSCVSSTSLNNIQHKWLTEITTDGTDSDPWTIIVGTKVDLREVQPSAAVSVAQAEDLAKTINACALVDTSAKTRTGVKELTQLMMDLAFMKIRGEARPKFGSMSSAAAEEITKKVTQNENTPSAEELEAGKKAEEQHKKDVVAKKEEKADHSTKPPPDTKGPAPTQPKKEKEEKKGGDQCSCVIA